MFLILILNALFASTFTIGKQAIMHCPPLFFITIRMIISGILLLGFVKWHDHKSLVIKKKDWHWFIPIVLFHIYLSYTFEYVGMNYLTAAKTCLLFNLSPFISALLSYVYFKEVMTPKKWVGLGIGFFGFLPIMLSKAPGVENTLGSIGPFSVPELMLIISVTAACKGWIALRKLTKDLGYSYFFVNGVGMLGGGILTMITSGIFETWPAPATLMQPTFLWPLILLIIIGNVICFNLQGYLLHIYSATLLSFFAFITPLFAALFDWLWFGQQVSFSFYLTIAFVSAGLYLFYQEELKQGYITHK
jgi:drug/metabolite transporter (DMT)-like permease